MLSYSNFILVLNRSSHNIHMNISDGMIYGTDNVLDNGRNPECDMPRVFINMGTYLLSGAKTVSEYKMVMDAIAEILGSLEFCEYDDLREVISVKRVWEILVKYQVPDVRFRECKFKDGKRFIVMNDIVSCVRDTLENHGVIYMYHPDSLKFTFSGFQDDFYPECKTPISVRHKIGHLVNDDLAKFAKEYFNRTLLAYEHGSFNEIDIGRIWLEDVKCYKTADIEVI